MSEKLLTSKMDKKFKEFKDKYLDGNDDKQHATIAKGTGEITYTDLEKGIKLCEGKCELIGVIRELDDPIHYLTGTDGFEWELGYNVKPELYDGPKIKKIEFKDMAKKTIGATKKFCKKLEEKLNQGKFKTSSPEEELLLHSWMLEEYKFMYIQEIQLSPDRRLTHVFGITEMTKIDKKLESKEQVRLKKIMEAIDEKKVTNLPEGLSIVGKCQNPECKKEPSPIKVCSECKSIQYCSVECQKQHWPEHKSVCKKT